MDKCACAMMIASGALSISLSLSMLFALAEISATGIVNPIFITMASIASAALAFLLAYGAYSLVCR